MLSLTLILWLSWAPPPPLSTETAPGESVSSRPVDGVRGQLGERVPFAEVLDRCITRIQAGTEHDFRCSSELAADLSKVDSAGLLSTSPRTEPETRKRLCIAATGKPDCPRSPPSKYRSSEVEVLWREAEEGREKLIAQLETLGELPVGNQERALALSDCITDRFYEFRADLRRLNEAISGRYALVVRGGVSLGAYQAGFLYYLGNYLRSYRAQLGLVGAPFEVATGSSAGGINAFIAALEGCSEPPTEPEQSLYYKVWVNLGLFVDGDKPLDSEWPMTAGLFDPELVTDQNLFSSKPFEQLEKNAKDWIDAHPPIQHCDVALGLTATRLDPRPVKIGTSNGKNDLTAPHAVERFGFRIREGRGEWRFENLRPGESEDRAGVSVNALDVDLAERYAELVGYGQLLNGILRLVRATGAFPLAFAPVKLNIGHSGGSESEVEFVDGGTFDNHPIQFASRLRRWNDDGIGADAPPLALVESRPYEFIMLEPSILSYEVDPTPVRDRPPGALALTFDFVGAFLVTARGAALLEAADELPWLRAPNEEVSGDYLSKIPARRQPVSGEHLGHFFGFFERDFRDFDYYVGMADARAFVEKHPVWSATAIHRTAMATANRGLERPEKPDVATLLQSSGEIDAAAKLAIIEHVLNAEFVVPKRAVAARGNFVALTLASRAFRDGPKHDLQAWVTELERAGFRYEDLSALDVALHSDVGTKLRRTVSHKCETPGSAEGCTADWKRVSALMRVVLGRLTDRFAAKQSPKSAKFTTMLLRAGADYGLDGYFGYRHDARTIDVALRVWGTAGFHGEGVFNYAGHVGGQAVGVYMAAGLNSSWYRWAAVGAGGTRSVAAAHFGLELTPVSLRMGVQQRRRGFAPLRGAVQLELAMPLHIDVFVHPEERAARWGLGFKLAVILLRHLVLSVDAKLRTDGCWGSEHEPRCLDRRKLNYPSGVRQKGVDEDFLFGFSVGWRMRPMPKSTWAR